MKMERKGEVLIWFNKGCFGHWELGNRKLLFRVTQANHCIVWYTQMPNTQLSKATFIESLLPPIGSLRCYNADGNENIQKAIHLISKITTLQVQNTFWYISMLSLHAYEMKLPSFTFFGGCAQAMVKFSFSFWTWIWFLRIQPKKSLPAFDEESKLE